MSLMSFIIVNDTAFKIVINFIHNFITIHNVINVRFYFVHYNEWQYQSHLLMVVSVRIMNDIAVYNYVCNVSHSYE